MFHKHAFAVQIGCPGRAPAGRTIGVAVKGSRPRRIVTGVWQRNPISGRLELAWQSAADDVASHDSDEPSSRSSAPHWRRADVVWNRARAARVILPDSKAA